MTYTLVRTLYPVLARKRNRSAAYAIAFILKSDDGYRALLWDASDDVLVWAARYHGIVFQTQTGAEAQAMRTTRRKWMSHPDYSRARRGVLPAKSLRAWLLATTDTGCGAPATRVCT